MAMYSAVAMVSGHGVVDLEDKRGGEDIKVEFCTSNGRLPRYESLKVAVTSAKSD